MFHSWSAQDLIDPLAVASAQGSYFWDYEGNRFLDFSSGLVFTNIGYQHPKVVAAIQEQAGKLATFAPAFAVEARSEAARLIAERTPGDLDKIFFTNGGAEAVENAVRMARVHTGRPKVLSAYRSYHGSTAAAINLTGDPRRWASDNGSAASSASGRRSCTARPSTRRTRRRSASAPSPTWNPPSPTRARRPSPRSSWRPSPAPRAS
ncbi:aminotransferase class III-fold pyridoxal phosphate-dependent enzyme [Actinomadura keratinilytica]